MFTILKKKLFEHIWICKDFFRNINIKNELIWFNYDVLFFTLIYQGRTFLHNFLTDKLELLIRLS